MVGPIIWLAILFALILAVRVAIILVFSRDATGDTVKHPNAGAHIIRRADWATGTTQERPATSIDARGKEAL